MKRKQKTYTISAVAEQYSLHPQTLRMYEREGLLKPSRSEGNTRLYTDTDLARLELILSLTRDLGVNLAGVEIILNMREKMDAMQAEFERFFKYLQSHADELTNFVEPPAEGTKVQSADQPGSPGRAQGGYLLFGEARCNAPRRENAAGAAETKRMRSPLCG